MNAATVGTRGKSLSRRETRGGFPGPARRRGHFPCQDRLAGRRHGERDRASYVWLRGRAVDFRQTSSLRQSARGPGTLASAIRRIPGWQLGHTTHSGSPTAAQFVAAAALAQREGSSAQRDPHCSSCSRYRSRVLPKERGWATDAHHLWGRGRFQRPLDADSHCHTPRAAGHRLDSHPSTVGE